MIKNKLIHNKQQDVSKIVLVQVTTTCHLDAPRFIVHKSFKVEQLFQPTFLNS